MLNFFKSKKKIDILVVCYANYCRSPVAEGIFKKLYPNLTIESAGILPMNTPNMDLRSRDFLIKNKYQAGLHNPSRISRKRVESSQIIYALDLRVMKFLNMRYKDYQHKIKLLNFLDPSISLADPYDFKGKEYTRIMTNIEDVCIKISKNM